MPMNKLKIDTEEETKQFLATEVSGQLFGVSVYGIKDVLSPQKIIPIPLAPIEVVGSLNLRGRIITGVDIRVILGLQKIKSLESSMSIVVEYKDDLYSLIVDNVQAVHTINIEEINHCPENFPKVWQDVSSGVYKLQDKLMIILDINKLFLLLLANKQQDYV